MRNFMNLSLLIHYTHCSHSRFVKNTNQFIWICYLTQINVFSLPLIEIPNIKHHFLILSDSYISLHAQFMLPPYLSFNTHPMPGIFHFLKWMFLFPALLTLLCHFLFKTWSSYFFWLMPPNFFSNNLPSPPPHFQDLLNFMACTFQEQLAFSLANTCLHSFRICFPNQTVISMKAAIGLILSLVSCSVSHIVSAIHIVK